MLRRLTVLVAFAFVCGCNNATERPKQPAVDEKPKDAKVNPTERPLMDDTALEFDGPSFTTVNPFSPALLWVSGSVSLDGPML